MKAIITTLLTLLFVSSTLSAEQPKQSAATFDLKTMNGKTIHIKGTENGLDIAEYKGKVIFLEFWGTHCPPCLASIPHYVDMINKYKGKLAMLGVEVQNTPKSRLQAFAQAKKINYDVVTYQDAGYFVDYIAQRAGWKGSIPFLLILDPKGNVITMQVGMLPQNVLEKVVNDYIDGNKTAAEK